jgi:hypothetical protein
MATFKVACKTTHTYMTSLISAENTAILSVPTTTKFFIAATLPYKVRPSPLWNVDM